MKIDLSQLTRAELYQLRLDVQNNIDQYEKAALNSLRLGIPVKEYELKKGRNSRKILREGELVKALTKEGIPFSDLYQSKLKGIPALEKLVNSVKTKQAPAILNSHIEVTQGKPSLVYIGESEDD